MNIRYFTSDDYSTLCEWWKEHKHSNLPLESLPLGVVVEDNNTSKAMTFLYTTTGCNIGQIAWTTSNPKNSARESYDAISLGIDALLVVCNKLNITNIVSFSNSKGLFISLPLRRI